MGSVPGSVGGAAMGDVETESVGGAEMGDAAGGGKVPAALRWLLLTGVVGLLLEAKGVRGPSAGQSREAVPVGTEGEGGGCVGWLMCVCIRCGNACMSVCVKRESVRGWRDRP